MGITTPPRTEVLMTMRRVVVTRTRWPSTWGGLGVSGG